MHSALMIAQHTLPMPNEVVDLDTGEVLTLLAVNHNDTGDYVSEVFGDPITLTWFEALETMVVESGFFE